MIAVIGGSGLAQLPELKITHRQIIRTPYGLPSAPVISGKLGQRDIVFLARHGINHTLAPHEINYRANIWALHSLNVERIVSISAVSSINEAYQPGTLVMPDDLIDYTYGRHHTFFEGQTQAIIHTDFSRPYATQWRETLLAHAHERHTHIHDSAVYGCIQGPRLPTRAEIRRYRQDGADVIGMTGMPEAILARELNIPYAHLCGIIGIDCGEASTNLFRDTQSQETIQLIRQLLVNL